MAKISASTTGVTPLELEILKLATRMVPPSFTEWIAATIIFTITLRLLSAS